MKKKKKYISQNISNEPSDNHLNFNYDNLNKKNDSKSKIKNIKSKNNEIKSDFGEFLLIMENQDEYRKEIIKRAKNKIWKVISKIKTTKDITKISNDPYKKKWYIINPIQNKYLIIFDYIFCFLLYLDFFLSPFEYLVYEPSYKYYRMAIFDTFFTFEIVSHFFTAFYDEQNKHYYTDVKIIFRYYLQNGFIQSLLYVLPLYIFHEKFEMLRFIKIYKYTSVNDKIRKLTKWVLSFILKNIALSNQITGVFTLFLIIVYIIHICTCIYCNMGLNYSDSWLFLHAAELDNPSIKEIYINGFYFLTETLTSTGYGDLTPFNDGEIVFIMFCQIIVSALYGYLLSDILEIFINVDNSDYYRYKADQVNFENWITYYMSKLPSISKKVSIQKYKIWETTKKYFDIYYNKNKNFEWIKDQNFIFQMKPFDRNELLNKSFCSIFLKFNSFFKRIHLLSSKIKIVMNLKNEIQITNTEIINNLSKKKKIYFIEKGTIDIYKNSQIIFSLTEGYFFGIESILEPENEMEKISYKVSEECPYTILFKIDIEFLFKEILNYDYKSTIDIIKLANLYIDHMLNGKESNLFIKEKNESIYEMGKYKKRNKKGEININNIFNEGDDNILFNDKKEIENNGKENTDEKDENLFEKRKLNIKLFQPGHFDELNKKLEEYYKAEKALNEAKLKIDLITKQINFIKKYVNILGENKSK